MAAYSPSLTSFNACRCAANLLLKGIIPVPSAINYWRFFGSFNLLPQC
jgi:hypothetical protein